MFAATGAALSLLILFWIIEYQFIGRYVIAYSAMGAGSLCYLLLIALEKLTKINPPRILLLVEEEKIHWKLGMKLEKSQKDGVWFDSSNLKSGESLEEFCTNQKIDYIVLDHGVDTEETQILGSSQSEFQFFSLAQFWETFFSEDTNQIY